jgi:hypothetical protein
LVKKFQSGACELRAFYEAVWTADDIPDPDVSPYNQNDLACGFIDTPSCTT